MAKIAILGTRGIPARYGGFETFAEQLANRLVTRGVDVTVFCPSDEPKSDEKWQGVTLRYVPSPRAGKFSEMIWDGKCYALARRGYDVVYMLGVGGAYAAWIPRLFGARVWVNTDGIEWKRTKFTRPQRAYLALAESLSALLATRVIADADAIADYLRRRYPRKKRITTIPYGADIPTVPPDAHLIDEWGLEPNRYYIAVCRLVPENHVLEIVEGFEQSSSSLPLVILGDIRTPNAYIRALLAHQSRRIRFLGTIFDREKLAALRFNSRAYLHGHSVGGTNPSLLEAMACSNLVIAHDNPFNREVLSNSGLFFQTVSDIGAHLGVIESASFQSQALRDAACNRIRERYLWDQVADAYEKLLEKDSRLRPVGQA